MIACCLIGPSHYLNQCWNIVNSHFRNKFQWNLKRNSCVFIQENVFENVVCEMVSILPRAQCATTQVITFLVIWHSQLIMNYTFSFAGFWIHEYVYQLTHWGWDKMAANFQTTLSNAFFFNENVWISLKISLKFVPKGPINNIPALIQIMSWRRPGDKPLSEPMLVSVLMHLCITQPQWVIFFCHGDVYLVCHHRVIDVSPHSRIRTLFLFYFLVIKLLMDLIFLFCLFLKSVKIFILLMEWRLPDSHSFNIWFIWFN